MLTRILIAAAAALAPIPALAQLADETPPPELRATVAANDAAIAKGGNGPFPAIMVSDPALPTHTLYRPRNLAAVRGTLPVIAWGNGACANIGNRFRTFLTEVASHGYLILAVGPAGPKVAEWKVNLTPTDTRPPAERKAPTRARQLIDAIDWALAENGRRGSPYYHRLDTKAVAVMGQSCGGLQAISAGADPRVRTVMVMNSGTYPAGKPALDGTGGVIKASLASLHSPILWISGDQSDVAFTNANADFAAFPGFPAFRAYEKGTGHSTAYFPRASESFERVSVAWLDWQLKHSASAARTFTGPNCTLCTDSHWVVQRKNIP